MCYYIRSGLGLSFLDSILHLSLNTLLHFSKLLSPFVSIFFVGGSPYSAVVCMSGKSPGFCFTQRSDIYKPVRQSSRSWEGQLRLRRMEMSLHFISISCFLSEYSSYFPKASQVLMKVEGCVPGLQKWLYKAT